MSSPQSQNSVDFEHNELEGDEVDDVDFDNSKDFEDDKDSEVDSDDASDESNKREIFTGIKEQMYHDKLSQLKKQLQQLHDGTHVEYNKKLKKLDAMYRERLRLNELWRELETELVEREYLGDKKLTGKKFEEKKEELKENMILELEEKKKLIEQERYSLDLTGDSMEYKPISTRKLRRRGNDPPPLVEKRRKPVSTTVQLLLEEKEVEEDLRIINKSKLQNIKKK